MATQKISFVSRSEPDVTPVEEQLVGIDYEMEVSVCKSDGETIEAVKGADLVINQGVPMPRAVIEELDRAWAIVSFGHGFDRIDDDAATEKSVMVVNTAGFCSEEVSNHAIMLLLACAKKLTILNDVVKRGGWSGDTRNEIGTMGPIDGQTLGLIGLGNIARATARKAKVFGLEVIAYDPFVEPWIAREYRIELVSGMEELARRSDYVSVHVPLNPQTRGLVGESFFRAMKPTAFIINTCRGGTIDEQALVAALRNWRACGSRPGRLRDGADAEGQPAAGDGQRHRDAALGGYVGRVPAQGARPDRAGGRPGPQGELADVARQSPGEGQDRAERAGVGRVLDAPGLRAPSLRHAGPTTRQAYDTPGLRRAKPTTRRAYDAPSLRRAKPTTRRAYDTPDLRHRQDELAEEAARLHDLVGAGRVLKREGVVDDTPYRALCRRGGRSGGGLRCAP